MVYKAILQLESMVQHHQDGRGPVCNSDSESKVNFEPQTAVAPESESGSMADIGSVPVLGLQCVEVRASSA